MRCGSICYATSRGLGHLCRDFHRKGLVTDVMIVEHPGVPTNQDWYPDAPRVPLRGIHSHVGSVQDFCRGKDVMLFFETPFHWPLLAWCRQNRIRTFLVTMYECTPRHHARPDVYLCPSVLDLDVFADHGEEVEAARDIGPGHVVGPTFNTLWKDRPGRDGARAVWVQLPVEYPWRLRERAEHFVHNGGYLGVRTRQGGVQREGTTTLIEAMRHVKSPIRLTVRVQENVSSEHQLVCAGDSRIRYVPSTVPYQELYGEGDVCVGAQRWNGCSLPLQEAFASGMLVMNTDRYPMNTWLPNEPLVPVRNWIKGVSIGGTYMTFDEAAVHPEDLAAKIDEWYGRDITHFSRWGLKWAEKNSWKALLPYWRKVLES